MRVGIVGAEAAKFTRDGEAVARDLIRRILLAVPGAVVVSGHCHLGGIDIWAEEIGKQLGCDLRIFPPATRHWNSGYKPRNLQIAHACDVLHNIVVDSLPEGFTGMRHPLCYHCKTASHVKSGGCWTMKQAARLGKPARLHVITYTTKTDTPSPRVEYPPDLTLAEEETCT